MAGVLTLWFVYLLIGSTNGFYWIDSWHNEQRAVQLILLVVTAANLILIYLVSGSRQLPVFSWPVWAVCVAGLLSATFAEFRFAAVAEVAAYMTLGSLVLTAAIVFRRGAGWSLWLKRAVLLLAVAHCLGILVRYGAALSLQRDLAADVLLLGFANPRFASALYVLLMPFLASHVMHSTERATFRYVALATLVMLWAFNLALGTRAVLFASALGLAGFAWMAWRRAPLALIWTMLATLVAGAALYAVMFHLIPSWALPSGGLVVRADPILSPNGRELLLSSSIASIRSAPLLGIGPMQFAAIPHVWAAHPHNWVLQLAAEYGPAIAVFSVVALGVWLWRLRLLIEAISEERWALGGPALLMTLVALAYGLVDGNLVMPVSQTAAAIGLGALLASSPPRPSGETRSSLAHFATGIAIAAAAVTVAAYGHVSFSEQEASVRRFREIYAKDRFFVPRFWEQGLLIKPN